MLTYVMYEYDVCYVMLLTIITLLYILLLCSIRVPYSSKVRLYYYYFKYLTLRMYVSIIS